MYGVLRHGGGTDGGETDGYGTCGVGNGIDGGSRGGGGTDGGGKGDGGADGGGNDVGGKVVGGTLCGGRGSCSRGGSGRDAHDGVAKGGWGSGVDHCGCRCGWGGADETVACCAVAYSAASDGGTTGVDKASSATSAADAECAKLHVGTVAPYCARDPGSKFAVGARAAAKIFSCRRIGGRCEGDAIFYFN